MTFEHDPERVQAIFRQRAIQLSQKRATDRPAASAIPALIFRLSGERYAIALRDVAEVLPFERCTPVPGSEPEFQGVINLRGEVWPVVDLARLLSATASSDSGAILILRSHIALKVDAVAELIEIRSDQMEHHVQAQYVRAILPGAVALLDVEAIWPAVSFRKESRLV